jgi:hypothetical protein
MIFHYTSLNLLDLFISILGSVFSLLDSLYFYIFYFFSLVVNIYLYCKDIFINLPFFTNCGFSLFGLGYIILYCCSNLNSCGFTTIVGYIILYSGAGRKIIDEIRKNAGSIGTGVVGLVTGLDAALNLGDRVKGDKGDKEGGSS